MNPAIMKLIVMQKFKLLKSCKVLTLKLEKWINQRPWSTNLGKLNVLPDFFFLTTWENNFKVINIKN